jgi:hypothetical protein
MSHIYCLCPSALLGYVSSIKHVELVGEHLMQYDGKAGSRKDSIEVG